MTDIVFLDTETTGIHPEREIWEIAMVKRTQDGVVLDSTTIQIADINLSKADPFALKINKFYDRYIPLFPKDPNKVPDRTHIAYPEGAAEEVEYWTRGCHIVGAVPHFDTESLDKLLRANEKLPAWHYHLIDVECLAIGYLKGLESAGLSSAHQTNISLPWKSDSLSLAIGVEPPSEEERHTAMGDVQWVIRTYDKIMGIN